MVAAWGWSGQVAYQFFVPGRQEGALREHLLAAAKAPLIEGDLAVLEALRIEAEAGSRIETWRPIIRRRK